MEENKAVFLDIDKTIIPNGSLHLLVQHLYKKKLIPLSLIFRVLYWYSLYKLNWINDFSKVIEKSNQLLGSFLDVYNIKQLTNLLDDWFYKEIKQLIYPELKNKIEDLYHQGYKIFFVTSTIQPVANLFKNYFGFGLVISTEIEEKDGYYTGYPTNKPCHGKEKLERIKLLQKEYNLDLSKSYAFSDHISDLYMLESVGNPVVVNPNPKLKRIAKKNNWEILLPNLKNNS
jgi:HAD superfamily hydrolase (TIGR01490 family)